LSTQSASAVGKLLELVRQLEPQATRVGALWDPVNAVSQQLRLGETLVVAARLQLLVRIKEVATSDDLERAFIALGSQRVSAVLLPGDTFFLAHTQRVVDLGLAHRLPVLSTNRVLTEAGTLASYGADVAVLARRSATYVQRILKGAKPGDLPIELPTKFELVLNMRTAKAIGIDVPPAIVARADDVIR
jgi:putative tryptophan/tyrosine transport system substrate-binding protein